LILQHPLQSVSKEDYCIQAIPSNDLLASNADDIQKELDDILEKASPKELILDIRFVEIIDSVGVAVVLSLFKPLKALYGKLRGFIIHEYVYKLFRMLNLNRRFEMIKT